MTFPEVDSAADGFDRTTFHESHDAALACDESTT